MRTVQDIMAENGSLANIERFQTMQKWEFKRKVEHAQEMAEAFYYWAKEHDKGVHLSVGGLDSITLHYFLESIGLPVTCVSCSSLEGKGVQQVHKQIAAEMETEYKNWMGEGEAPSFVFLKPLKSKVQVLQEFGWPVISKEKAGKIMLLQNPTEQNATVRHAIITGETGEYGEIARDKDGNLYTTKAQRTGCTMCGFGIHVEGRPHRFDILRETNPKEWEFWMKHVCRDENGDWYGWGRVLDYIGIGWEDVPEQATQMCIDDFIGGKA